MILLITLTRKLKGFKTTSPLLNKYLTSTIGIFYHPTRACLHIKIILEKKA